MENEKRGVPAAVIPVKMSRKRGKHRSHQTDRMNPLAVVVVEGASASAEGASVQ